MYATVGGYAAMACILRLWCPADCLEEPESVEVGAHGFRRLDHVRQTRPGFVIASGLEAAIGIDPHLVHIHLRKNLADALLGLFDRGDARGMDVVHTRIGLGFEVGVVDGVEHHQIAAGGFE